MHLKTVTSLDIEPPLAAPTLGRSELEDAVLWPGKARKGIQLGRSPRSEEALFSALSALSRAYGKPPQLPAEPVSQPNIALIRVEVENDESCQFNPIYIQIFGPFGFRAAQTITDNNSPQRPFRTYYSTL